MSADPPPNHAEDEPDSTLAVHTLIAVLLGALVTVVWWAAGRGPFWPEWVWLGLGTSVGLNVVWELSRRGPRGAAAVYRTAMAACVLLAAVVVAVWALSGGGRFWPMLPLTGLGFGFAVLAVFRYRRLLPGTRRDLVERVDVLTRTRSGALDAQAAELRRIERDLHDGAQARLVALSMQLGRAEQRLSGHEDTASYELVRQARQEASAAIAELRDLSRGIAPPVLADRGLSAAAEALARRSPMPVAVESSLEDRLLPVVESAAYFVVAESLTNVVKHSPGASATVRLRVERGYLHVVVRDDGRGGAVALGGGLSGLRSRVEALDGTLTIASPPNGGTTIHAELPCAS
ncbi:MAG: histidine kinase [Patulibacter sp.]|nr:histidine kinase [Patulibacter sp.]